MVPTMANHRTPFHSTARWQKARRVAKIEAKYTCARCNAFLPGKGELHVHHRKPVAKSMALALEPLNLMPVCPQCHNVIEPRTGSRRQSGCDEQGRPTDPQHPWNAEARGEPRKSGT
jgi:5-methylcytosine-specific restriction endonuclease McrA